MLLHPKRIKVLPADETLVERNQNRINNSKNRIFGRAHSFHVHKQLTTAITLASAAKQILTVTRKIIFIEPLSNAFFVSHSESIVLWSPL